MFDEVMTNRMSTEGMQKLLGIYPDMTTLGKYFGGGEQNFGAFGESKEIMTIIEPGHPNGVYHSGAYNNNATTMAARAAVLEEVWTEGTATELFKMGDWLRNELRKLSEKADSIVSPQISRFRVSNLGAEDDLAG